MSKKVTIRWRAELEAANYPAALSYLSLVHDEDAVIPCKIA